MLTLYDYLPSQNAWKVRLLLAQLGLAYETREVSIFEGAGQTAEHLARSPMGVAPALVLDDGRALAESNAILIYLATGTPMLPEDPFARAKVQQWLLFETAYIQPTIGLFRYMRLARGAPGAPPGALQTNIAYRAMNAMDRQLATTRFIAGEAYTVADISLYAYTHVAPEGGFDLAPFPHIRRWLQAVQDRPGFGPPVHPYSLDPAAATNDLPSFTPWGGAEVHPA